MRVRAFIGAAIAAICLGSTSSGNAAEDKTVEACLTGSAYLDAAETVDQCDKALRVADISPRTRSAVNLQIGEAFYFAGRPGIAIPYLDEAIKLDPKSGQAFRRRGWSQLRLENISAAIADFTEFMALSPDDPDALFAIAFALDSTTHNCAAAASDYERILEHHPGHYLTRKALAGEYACIDGHGMRQLQELNKILAAGRDAIADTNYFGRRGRNDRDFYAAVLEERAGIYYDTRQWKEAAADFTWLIDHYPFIFAAHINRSYTRMETGDVAGALADADAALALQPAAAAAQLARLTALNVLKRNDDMISFANTVLATGQMSPLTPKIHFFRGIAWKRRGHRGEALEDFHRAVAGSPGVAWAMHMHLGDAGYLFSPYRDRTQWDGGPPVDIAAKEFTNAMTACMLDPECLK